MSAIEHALLAVMAADGGDSFTAHGHISAPSSKAVPPRDVNARSSR